jgi:hypothetical protein
VDVLVHLSGLHFKRSFTGFSSGAEQKAIADRVLT